MNIENLYNNEISKFMHSIINKYNPPAFDHHLSETTLSYPTRSSENTLFEIPTPRTCLGKKSIKYIAPHIWTNLPRQIRSLQKRNIFSHKLKSHLIGMHLQVSDAIATRPSPLPSPKPARPHRLGLVRNFINSERENRLFSLFIFFRYFQLVQFSPYLFL